MWAAPDPDKMRSCSTPAPTSTRDRTTVERRSSITSGSVGAAPRAAAAARVRRRSVAVARGRSIAAARSGARRRRRDVRRAARVRRRPERRRRLGSVPAHRTASRAPSWPASPPAARCRDVRRPSDAGVDGAALRSGPRGAADAGRRHRRRRPPRSAPRSSAACRCCRTSASRSSTRPAASPVITTASSRWRSPPRARTAIAVNEATAKTQASAIGTYLESWRERTRAERVDRRRQPTRSAICCSASRPTTIRRTRRPTRRRCWLKRRQAPRRTLAGQTHPAADRIQRHRGDGGLDARASGVRAAVAARRIRRRGRSRARLADDRQGAVETEERAFRLLGLRWAGAPNDVIAAAARDLLAIQHDDGGWAQRDDDGQRRLCDRRGAGRAARERRGRGRPIARTAKASSICCARRSTMDRGWWRRGRCRFRRTSRAAFRTA